jgi:hypothetical protein
MRRRLILAGEKTGMNAETRKLFWAADEGDLASIKASIERSADVNAVNSFGDTPLIVAIASERSDTRIEILNLLLDSGADPDYKGDENCGVLYQAVLLKDPEVMDLLLSAGADPNFLLDGKLLYERALFDYLYDAFNLKLPLEPTEQDSANEEAWLDFLERCADEVGVFRPEFLRSLLKYLVRPASE